MFLVIYGHSIQYLNYSGSGFWGDSVFKFIYTFHMPAFMFISGYLSKNIYSVDGFQRNKIISRVCHLLIPPFFLSALREALKFSFAGFVVNSVFGAFKILWFLWAVCFSILFVSIFRYFKIPNIWIFVISLLVSIFIPANDNLAQILYVLPFYCAGVVFEFARKSILKGIFLLSIYFIGFFLWDQHTFVYVSGNALSGDGVFNSALRLIVGFSFILGMLNFSLPQKALLIAPVGRISLEIYILQAAFFSIFANYLSLMNFKINNFYLLMVSLVLLCVFSLGALVINKFWALRFLVFGKK